jgi:hypothetical protein
VRKREIWFSLPPSAFMAASDQAASNLIMQMHSFQWFQKFQSF